MSEQVASQVKSEEKVEVKGEETKEVKVEGGSVDEKKEAPQEKKEEPKEEPKEDRFASKFSALSKKEKAIREKERSIAEREKKIQEFENLSKRAKEDPEAFLNSHGLSWEYLTEYLTNGKKPPESIKFDRLGDEVKQLKEQLVQEQRKREEAELSFQQKQAMSYLEGFAKTNSEKYPLIANLDNGLPLVWETVRVYHEENGEAPQLSEAFDHVENHLRKSEEERLKKLKSVSVFKSLFAPDVEPPKSDPSNGQVKEAGKTLTNAPSSSAMGKPSRMNDEQRLRYIASSVLKNV